MEIDEVRRLEQNIIIKNKAEKMYADFIRELKLHGRDFVGDGRFKIWSD